jgi:hypothetical protein
MGAEQHARHSSEKEGYFDCKIGMVHAVGLSQKRDSISIAD